METKKIWVLMAMVLLSGGLVLGGSEIGKAGDGCNFSGATGEIAGSGPTATCEKVNNKDANWWCNGSWGDCTVSTDDDYAFCQGNELYKIKCKSISAFLCSDPDGGGCSANSISKADCSTSTYCKDGYDYKGKCYQAVDIGDPIRGCIRNMGSSAWCDIDLSTKTCDDTPTGCCGKLGKVCDGGVCKSPAGPCIPKTAADCGANECGLYPDGCGTGGTYDCGSCTVGECTGNPGVCVSTPCCSLTGTLSCFSCQGAFGTNNHGIGMYTKSGKVYCAGFLDTSKTTGTICLYEDGSKKEDSVGDGFGNGAGETNCSNIKRNIGTGETHSYECRLYSGSTCGAGDLLCSTSAANYSGPPAPPAASCTPDDCNGNCPVGCTGVDDPDCGGTCLDCTCDTDTDCAAHCGDDGGCCLGCSPPDVNCGGASPSPAPPAPAPPPSGPASPCGLGTGMFCNPLFDPSTGTGWSSIPDIAEGMLNYLLGLVGSIALLFLIIAGVMYMTAGGSEEKITTAKRILTGAIIGLGIVLLAYSLLAEINKILNP